MSRNWNSRVDRAQVLSELESKRYACLGDSGSVAAEFRYVSCSINSGGLVMAPTARITGGHVTEGDA